MSQAAEMYVGEAMDSAMMLARIEYPEVTIVEQLAANFPTLSDAKVRDIARESLRRARAGQ